MCWVAFLEDLVDLLQDCLLIPVLLHQLPEVSFGEVSPDAGVIGMGTQDGEHAFRQLLDRQHLGQPGVVLTDGSGKGTP